MAESSIVKTKRDGTLVIADNAGANSLTIAFEAGDLSLTIPGPTVSNYLDRGRFSSPPSLRYIDDQPITGTFTAYLRSFGDDADPDAVAVLAEIIAQQGFVASDWVSTLGVNGEVQCYTLTWTVEGTDHGDDHDHVLELQYVVFTGSISEGDPDQISISFTSHSLYPTLT